MQISPEIRRLIIQYAANENLTFDVALECLVLEGVKALSNDILIFSPKISCV